MATVIALPPYTPSPPVPSYSPEPAHDEARVEHTPRPGIHATGNWIKKSGGDAVVLSEQDSAAELPTYRHHASITGFVTLENRETVSEVVLKVKGRMDVMISEGGSQSIKLVNDSYTLWSSTKSHTSTCPGAVPFSVVLPTKFRDENLATQPLPPSYEVPVSLIRGLLFKSAYTLSVAITRTRSRKLQFLSKTKTISVRFNYSPRTRPWRSIHPSSDFLSDVKIIPEEFRQVDWSVQPRPKSSAQPLDLHLFIPTVGIFALADTVPFHVQLSGPVAALRQFLPDPGDTPPPATGIAVSLVRQIVVELNGRRAARSVVIGHARLSSRPPGADAYSTNDGAGADGAAHASVDWAGDVRCGPAALVGAFDAGCVRVHDFIVVELRPRSAQTIPQYTTLRHSHPVKFVSDPWVDSASSRDGWA